MGRIGEGGKENMLWICAALAALAVGALRGGSLRHYARRPLRGLWMPCAALLLAAVPEKAGRWLGAALRWELTAILVWGLLAWFVVRNLDRRGMKWVALGAGIQGAACLIGGARPVGLGLGGGLAALWRGGAHAGHAIAEGLGGLSHGFFSGIVRMIGDVAEGLLHAVTRLLHPQGLVLLGGALMGIGVFLLVLDIMCPPAQAKQPEGFRAGV